MNILFRWSIWNEHLKKRVNRWSVEATPVIHFFPFEMLHLVHRLTISPYSIHCKVFTRLISSSESIWISRLIEKWSFIFLKAMLHGFFDFENFDLDEYEHYEVVLRHCLDEHRSIWFLSMIESGKWRLKLDRSQEIISLLWTPCQE